MRIPVKALSVAAFALAVATTSADATVVRVSETDFQANAGLITFSEFLVGSINPTFTPADYGGGAGAPTVTTGGFFVGQSLSATPGIDCPGAAATACVVGTPTGPLTLDAAAPNVFITTDGSFSTSPTLSGSPRFAGPIALLFSEDQFGVGFDGGFFDAAMSTGITAFDRSGNLLGTVSNQNTGIEFLGLVSSQNNIAGVFLDLVGAEPSGFNIDNVRFGSRGQITAPPTLPQPPGSVVPLPAGLPLILAGLAGLGLVSRRRKA